MYNILYVELKNKERMMCMKKRFVDTRGEDVLTKKRFLIDSVKDENFNADLSLIDMIKSIKRKEILRENGRVDCILDSGFKWLGLYPKGESYAITGLYNEKNELVEFYFDMIKENGRESNKIYVLDTYLDLVITPNNEKYVLDEEELEEALENNQIDKVDYDIAYDTLHRLQKEYETQDAINKLKEIMDGYLKRMYEKIQYEKVIVTNL